MGGEGFGIGMGWAKDCRDRAVHLTTEASVPCSPTPAPESIGHQHQRRLRTARGSWTLESWSLGDPLDPWEPLELPFPLEASLQVFA